MPGNISIKTDLSDLNDEQRNAITIESRQILVLGQDLAKQKPYSRRSFSSKRYLFNKDFRILANSVKANDKT